MNRHIKAQKDGKFQQIVPPGTMRFLDFARLSLGAGEKHSGATGSREYAFDIFSGRASMRVKTSDGTERVFRSVGEREDVFAGPPVMVFVPPQVSYEIEAATDDLDVGVFSAPSHSIALPRVLAGADVVARDVGRDNWQRTVYSALAENVQAERLLAGETLNPPGNWSSYPPHKHDQPNPPKEVVLEEIYFFRVKPAQGYGFIWTYTAPNDPEGFSTVFVIEDGDTVLLPKGYHPVVAAPGYQLHYTWVLAGEERRYGAWADDPRHAWVKGQ
ncbi:MAG: 5-deoxy-glucuronate isomerase [Acidobacteriia bacterium]|nr:5-deoxy-glucuronate isomerase [Terriglobia bacterium]